MPNQEEYIICIQIHSQYQFFDKSGQIPFNIVFGLSRRYQRTDPDTDLQPILLDISGSVFDVPYAVAKGYLKLSGPGLDLSGFDSKPAKSRYISLPPILDKNPLNRLTDYVTYLYRLEPGSKLAGLLEAGIKYKLELATRQLLVHWWAFGEASELLVGEDGAPLIPPEKKTLVSHRIQAGNAQFLAKAQLSMPPRLEISMRLLQQPSSSQGESSLKCIMETTILQNGSHPLTYQSCDYQYFEWPRGPWGFPSPATDLFRTRIGNPDFHAGKRSFTILDSSTNKPVFHSPPRSEAGCGRQPRPPHRSMTTTLFPGVPLTSHYDLSDVVKEFRDGLYSVHLERLGAWWAWGRNEEIFVHERSGQMEMENARVKMALWYPSVVPLWLASEDVIKLRIVRGICVVDSEEEE